MNITKEINCFREAARHIWNSYMSVDADFDSADAFMKVCGILYEEQVLKNISAKVPIIPIDHGGEVLTSYHIFMSGNGKLPLMVNRDIPASGYWDYPIDWISPEEKPVIHPIDFFDWDILGMRNIEYYRARIIQCPSHPQINGRDVLIRCNHVEIELVENLPDSEKH